MEISEKQGSEQPKRTAIESLTSRDLSMMEKPSDFTVYASELEEEMNEGKVPDDPRYCLPIAALWRIADAGNVDYFSGEEASKFLDSFYKFAENKVNREAMDRVFVELTVGVWDMEDEMDWGLQQMSDKMENFLIKYAGERLAELREGGNEEKYNRFAKRVVEIIDLQEANARVEEAEIQDEVPDLDDEIVVGMVGSYRLSEKLVNGFKSVLTEADLKASEDEFAGRVEKLREELGQKNPSSEDEG